jgi:ferrochelatase
MPYDAVLLLSFGGPEGPDDVIPFLENVVRGKRVPRERLLEVAERYELFDGVSPINAQNRAILAALIAELNSHGMRLPVYWGNRNWHPLLVDTVREMADDGVKRALAFVTSAFGSYSGCRQYLEDIQRAREEVGLNAPQIDKIRLFYNHPGFIEAQASRVTAALEQVPAERRDEAVLLFSAHSIPRFMAATSPYEGQLHEACQLVAEQAGRTAWQLVYQSRSGPPHELWLEPDLLEHLASLGQSGQIRDVVLVPIGFISEHMEVVYDLDIEAQAVCEHFNVHLVRAAVVGTHPRFVTMIRELIEERTRGSSPRRALGAAGPWPDECPSGCCLKSRDQWSQ